MSRPIDTKSLAKLSLTVTRALHKRGENLDLLQKLVLPDGSVRVDGYLLNYGEEGSFRSCLILLIFLSKLSLSAAMIAIEDTSLVLSLVQTNFPRWREEGELDNG